MCRLLRLSSGRSQLLLVENGFEACDFATQLGEFMRTFDLAGLLAQAEVDVCVVRVAELLLDFGLGHFADIFCSTHSE